MHKIRAVEFEIEPAPVSRSFSHPKGQLEGEMFAADSKLTPVINIVSSMSKSSLRWKTNTVRPFAGARRIKSRPITGMRRPSAMLSVKGRKGDATMHFLNSSADMAFSFLAWR
jgi:hypothetical protein